MSVRALKNQCEPEPRVKVVPIKCAPITPTELFPCQHYRVEVLRHTHSFTKLNVFLLSVWEKSHGVSVVKCLFLHLSALLNKHVHFAPRRFTAGCHSKKVALTGKL